MLKTFTEFSTNAVLNIGNESLLEAYKTTLQIKLFTFILTSSKEAKVVVDNIPYTVPPNSLMVLTSVQYFQFISGKNLIVYQFNRDFYCIKDHDKEVSCMGLLFFGNTHAPIIELKPEDQLKFNSLHKVFIDELETQDNIQAEMLRMLMARFIIISTRLLKSSSSPLEPVNDTKTNLLREFNILVEAHFKTSHNVVFYAEKLFKSPKTLSNTFAKLNTSPLKVIHDRIILEAKRLLIYTDKAAKEIAYELGFDDASHLSRLFKKHTGLSPSSFRNNSESIV